jgi:hypothetical protein
MRVDAEALRNRLEARVRHGRTPSEAAGEVRWLVEVERRMGVLSSTKSDAATSAIDEWLAQTTEPEGALADAYARFIDERVQARLLNPPPWDQIDVAWTDWRATR